MRLGWQPPDLIAAAPFWEATQRGELALPWCPTCEAPVLYPRDFCPRCHTTGIAYRTLSGRGTVYSFGVEHRSVWGSELEPPFVVALIDLEEGGRMVSNVLDDPARVHIGAAVEVEFQPIDDGRAVPRFRLVEAVQ